MGRKHRRKFKSAQQSEQPKQEAGISNRYRFFLWLCGFFALAGLILRIDVITAWSGAEGWSLDAAVSGKSRVIYLPTVIQSWLSTLTEPFYLAPRVLSISFLLGTAMIFQQWGSRLFGKETSRLAILVAASGLWIPFFGKVATADSWALFGHVGLVLATAMQLRSGKDIYKAWMLGFTIISLLAAPLSTFLMAILLTAIYWKNKELRQVLFAILPLCGMVVPLFGLPVDRTYYFWGSISLSSQGDYLLYAFLGVLPQVGWWLASGRDAVLRFKKGDELIRLLLPFILVTFLAQSLALFVVLGILVAKQMENYFRHPYPWVSWVRAGATLHLIFAFFAALLGLFAGLSAFSGDGYRATLGAAAAYWIFSLFGVIGLYGMKKDFALGGTILSGLIAT
ncbi:MAG: hypothetical protein AAF544_12695, partial [Bacteroidota bacterium]